MSTLSLIPEEKRRIVPNPTSKSMESLYSSSSSKFSGNQQQRRKKIVHKQTNNNMVAGMSEIRQRVMSARLLSTKHLQNQLSDAQLQISELANENRILRTLHKRQDSALSKYESTKAELPQLLHSHAEEIRSWQSKYKQLQLQNRELNGKMKQKDAALLVISDQNKHLVQLNKDKTLEDREKLTERVKQLETRIIEKDNDTKLLARRLQLEAKNFKTQLLLEHQKFKDISLKLEKSNLEILRLTGLFDAMEKNKSVNSFSRSYVNIKSMRQNNNNNNGNNNKDQKPSNMNLINHSSNLNNMGSTTTLASNITSSLPLQVITDKATFSSISEVIEPKQSKIPIHSPYRDKYSNRSFYIDNQQSNSEEKLLHTATYSQKTVTSSMIKNGISQIVDNSFSSEENGHQIYSDDDDDDDVDDGDNNHYGDEYDDYDDDNDNNTDVIVTNTYDKKIKSYEEKIIENTEKEIINSESSSSPDDVDILAADFKNISTISLTESAVLHDFEKFKKEIHDEIMAKESILDTLCETATLETTDISKISDKKQSKLEKETKKNIDPKKKKKLLAALKKIDHDSFDS